MNVCICSMMEIKLMFSLWVSSVIICQCLAAAYHRTLLKCHMVPVMAKREGHPKKKSGYRKVAYPYWLYPMLMYMPEQEQVPGSWLLIVIHNFVKRERVWKMACTLIENLTYFQAGTALQHQIFCVPPATTCRTAFYNVCWEGQKWVVKSL